MKSIESIAELQLIIKEYRSEGKSIGLVPTMGFLHEGHLSLIDLAKKKSDIVIVSNFVNQLQFSPNEDFKVYPRDLIQDLKLCQERGADIVFTPQHGEIYPKGFSTYINEEKVSTDMCGISRPGHFRGVTTIVLKLLNIVQPDYIILGQKDAQQIAVVRRILIDLHINTEVIVGPTIREEDGIAKSSRNNYLSEVQRRDARAIYKALLTGKKMFDDGTRNVDRIMAEVIHVLTEVRRIRVIYVTIVNIDTMKPVKEIVPEKTIIATAVWMEEVRLIDNIIF